MNAAVIQLQLSFDHEGLDPHELAKLSTPERERVYAKLGLDALQIAAAEEAVRRVLAKRYGGRP